MNPTIKARIVPAQDLSHGECGVSITRTNGEVVHFPIDDIEHVTFHGHPRDIEFVEPEIIAEEPWEDEDEPPVPSSGESAPQA
jgi:hypothetical protein